MKVVCQSLALLRDTLKKYIMPEIIFKGDTYQQDIVGAKRVQFKTVWLNNRHKLRELAAANPPDYEIASLAELMKLPIFAG